MPADEHSIWQQCYAYFGLPDERFDNEIASLRLAFYHASFGMFRASGQTRKLSLADFGKIVTVCRKHRELRDRDPDWLERCADQVLRFLGELRVALGEVGVSATDTLVTKIALGTTACLPAYDRFAKLALRDAGITATPSERGLKHLFALRKTDLLRFSAKFKDGTPFMRMLDLELWRKGEELNRQRAKKSTNLK